MLQPLAGSGGAHPGMLAAPAAGAVAAGAVGLHVRPCRQAWPELHVAGAAIQEPLQVQVLSLAIAITCLPRLLSN